MTKTERNKIKNAMERIATYRNRHSCIALDCEDSELADRYAKFYKRNQSQSWYTDFKITESDKAAEARLTALALFMVAEQDVIE